MENPHKYLYDFLVILLVTSSFNDLMEICVCIYSYLSQVVVCSMQNFSFYSSFSKIQSLLNQTMGSYLNYLICILIIKKTTQIPLDNFHSNTSCTRTYTQLIVDNKLYPDNSTNLVFKYEILYQNILQYFQNISACTLIMYQISKYRNQIHSFMHYFVVSYLVESYHIVSLFSSSLLLTESDSSSKQFLLGSIIFYFRKEFRPCAKYITTLNLDFSSYLQIIHKNISFYLKVFPFIQLLVQILYNCSDNLLNGLFGIYSIFPTEMMQLEFLFNACSILSKFSRIKSCYYFSFPNNKEIDCEFGSFPQCNGKVSNFQILNIFYSMSLTLYSQHSFNEELSTIAHLYQSALPNFSFSGLIHFKHIRDLSEICDVVNSGVLLSVESFYKCIKLNYNIKMMQNSDGLILY